MNVLITGSSGFIGSNVFGHLRNKPLFTPITASRNAIYNSTNSDQSFIVNNLGGQSDFFSTIHDVDVVIHLAARVHILHETSENPEAEFKSANTEVTLSLASQAASSGVKRFIFLSTIKVNGDYTVPYVSFGPDDRPNPPDAFSRSKFDAECGLLKIAEETGMEVVIIRSPLVYGPGVKGNFASLISLVSKGFPLPFGALKNKRSLIGVDNLVDFIITSIEHPAAANQTFLVSDGEDLSTTDLLKRLANAMGKPSRLIPFPAPILDFAAKLLGKQAVAQRLLGSLQVDISKAKNLLGWEPPVSVNEGLKRAVSGD